MDSIEKIYEEYRGQQISFPNHIYGYLVSMEAAR